MQEVKRETKRCRIELLILPTLQALEVLERDPGDTNAVLHVTSQLKVNGSGQARSSFRAHSTSWN